jgi:amino acid transporter
VVGPSRLRLVPLIGATYFIVSGGPYGIEELVRGAGYRIALLALLVVPVVWSLPTALLVGELGAALPDEGGYYTWVRRGLGRFWGVQEAWLSLLASVFDMGIYPTLFATYLARVYPFAGRPMPRIALGVAMIAACVIVNLRGARAVGRGSLVFGAIMLSPFVVLAFMAFGSSTDTATPWSIPGADLTGGLLVVMWNTMGFDGASTFAGEVDNPQRNYPVAMVYTTLLVIITYVLPVLAARNLGFPSTAFDGGAWVAIGSWIGGPWLGHAIVLGGLLSAAGMFNALLLSYSRLPLALAVDGYLPAWLARCSPKTGVPVAAVLVLSVAWAASLGLGFDRLVLFDVTLYGLSLLLEFAALLALRLREPHLARPFRIPGGVLTLCLMCVPPMGLLAVAFWHERSVRIAGVPALWISGLFVLLGAPLYLWGESRRRRGAAMSGDRG